MKVFLHFLLFFDEQNISIIFMAHKHLHSSIGERLQIIMLLNFVITIVKVIGGILCYSLFPVSRTNQLFFDL